MGIRCPRALWFKHNRPRLRIKFDEATLRLFRTGHLVGDMAMEFFNQQAYAYFTKISGIRTLMAQYFERTGAYGIEVKNSWRDVWGGTATTNALIGEGHEFIYEATAIHPESKAYCRIDALRKVPEDEWSVPGEPEWDMFEVKSSTRVKDYHYDDLAFQYYVFAGAGYKIRNCSLMLVNKEYVRQGDLNAQEFFKLEDITAQVKLKQDEVRANVAQLIDMIKGPDPDTVIGKKRCHDPGPCGYLHHCWRKVPKFSVFTVISRSGKADALYREIGVDPLDIPMADRPKPQTGMALVLKAHEEGKKNVNRAELQRFVNTIEWPVRHIDFETIMPAIPKFDGTSPFQQIPFQFSVHLQERPNSPGFHHDFLHEDTTDPRRAFAEALIEAAGDKGSVVVYNKSFEAGRVHELAHAFPDLADDLNAISKRMVDIMVPFQKRWLYHPAQKVSYSLKAVLPAFTDDTAYRSLQVSDGGAAMRLYEDILDGEIVGRSRQTAYKNLRRYCCQDTMATKKLLDMIYRELGVLVVLKKPASTPQ